MKEILKKIKDNTWRKRGKWYPSVIFSEMLLEGESTSSQKGIGHDFEKSMTLWLDTGDYLDLEEEWFSVRKKVDKKYEEEPLYLLNYAKQCQRLGEEVVALSKNIQKISAKTLSDKKLAEVYKKIITKIKGYMPFMFTLHLVDEFLTQKFDSLLEKHIKEDYFDYHIALTTPFKKIFVLQERENLLKIAVDIKSKGLDPGSKEAEYMLKDHMIEYSWMNAVHLEKQPSDIDHFKQKLKDISQDAEQEYNSLIKEDKRLREKQKQFMEEIKDNLELHTLANTIQIFGFLRSFRADVLNMAYNNCWNIIKEIAERLDIEPIDIRLLDIDEINQSILSSIDYKELISRRKKGFISMIVDGKRQIIDDKDMIDQIKESITMPEEIIEENLKGQIAYPGNIKGKVKVLHNQEDMKKVEKGDIIVISMTDPNYLPVMEKASAFVTDFGGILCHAAIVSREMKKPCIIGTKHATQILKDGDLVEVDADKGTVKIIP